MSTTLVPKSKSARLGRPFLAAALALAASAVFAGAEVRVTSFTVTTDGIEFVAPKFAFASDPFSELRMAATNAGGGLFDGDLQTYTADTWAQGNNVTAQTSAGMATGNIVTFTDGITALQTGGFNLSASAMRLGFSGATQPSTGEAYGRQTGGFTLLDGDGNATAGMITFDVFYDLAVSTTVGSAPSDYTDTLLSFEAWDAQGYGSRRASLGSESQPGGVGSLTNGHFQLSFNLAAGEVVNYSLSGNAFAAAAPVPEPAALAMTLVGLMAVGASVRKARRTA